MAIHPQAGQPASLDSLIDVTELIEAYHSKQPDISLYPEQNVVFGTSGHRGTALNTTFNEHHILAIAQAVVDYRQQAGITGPLFLGKDTHALSDVAYQTVLRVLLANNITVKVEKSGEYIPTPVISHAILTHNETDGNQAKRQADGIVITPSHNPPEDGGIKYNTIAGGPADTAITDWIAKQANFYLKNALEGVKKLPVDAISHSPLKQDFDYIEHYVDDLQNVIDMQAIAKAGVKIGVDPMGGSGIHYWQPIAEKYGLNIEVVNKKIDPTFAFMPLDKDGRIRMDCSSSYAMGNLLKVQQDFDIAVANDPDYDRHGIVCPDAGLMNPNAYLAVAIAYLAEHRPEWSKKAQFGKTLVSSAMIDRVVAGLERELCEVPVGFKWYVEGLFSGAIVFGGEESAGASFLRKNGQVWTTDKDGFILALLAAEILAVTGKTPSQHYQALVEKYGQPYYQRIDVPTTASNKVKFANMDINAIDSKTLAGDPIIRTLTKAPGNGASIGGLKMETQNGWFAARPSGTENIYKIYLESFVSETHLAQLEQDAKQIINRIFTAE
ncbi:alpha-D-glucose phosphate-specific phosphoglucomutase [Marinomonas agarivorans]|nr:alpha-D-glucose phosphate-specific phosphoglucomutase [Marinomonas agarivorans]